MSDFKWRLHPLIGVEEDNSYRLPLVITQHFLIEHHVPFTSLSPTLIVEK